MTLSPQHVHCSADSTADRIKKSPRWDNEEGVAATVGTIMALLVFLTFFGMFTNQFVPVWMSDNESSHMSQAIQQFTTLKSSVDIAVVIYANSLVAPATISVPVTLSAPGIPIFAAATAGILQFTPQSVNTRPMFDVTYIYESTGGFTNTLSPANDGRSGGDLDLYCPNRYFVEQHLVWENGAVILNQTDGEFIIAGPQFTVRDLGTPSSPNRVVMLTQVSLQGTNKTIGGTGSKLVTADLLYAGPKVYENDNGASLSITIVTKHGMAWARYFNSSLQNPPANLTYGSDYWVNWTLHEQTNRLDNYYTVTITIAQVKVLDHTKATVKLSIGELGV